MIIIGEKINGTIPSVKKAIERKDEAFIHDLTLRQVEAGANYLDISAGTAPDVEVDTLEWLMDIVQDAVETPLCIDSPSIRVIEQVLPCAKRAGIINSISEEGGKSDILFPIIRGTEWQVIAQTSDSRGIPKDIQTRVDIAKTIVEKAQKYDIAAERIHIDPLVTALATDNQSLLNFVETAREVRKLYPTIKVTSGLSNISFGLPVRKLLNQAFLVLAMNAGMNSAVLDPCNRDLMGLVFATEALLGMDDYCIEYIAAYRKRVFGPVVGSKEETRDGRAQTK